VARGSWFVVRALTLFAFAAGLGWLAPGFLVQIKNKKQNWLKSLESATWVVLIWGGPG
jgi:hypothetical protein